MKALKLLVPLLLLFNSCSSDMEIINIEREGTLLFHVDGYDQVWKSNKINVYQGPSVVKFFPGDPDISIIFRRKFIVFEGDIPEGGKFELTVTLDLGDEINLRHAYTTSYNQLKGGLSQISLIITGTGNSEITLAELCEVTSTDAHFTILRQDPSEKLIAGTIDANLCLQLAPDTKFVIYNAEFKDIKY